VCGVSLRCQVGLCDAWAEADRLTFSRVAGLCGVVEGKGKQGILTVN